MAKADHDQNCDCLDHGCDDRRDPRIALHTERLEGMTGNKGSVPQRRAWMVNQIFRFFEHQWIYDFDEIVHAAVSAGFDREKIFREEFQSGLLENVPMLDWPGRNDETLYVEMIV